VKKALIIPLILLSLIVMGAGLQISQKIRVVILPGKTMQGWTEDDVDYLISILEETMLNLGRFELYSRQNLKEIMKERGLSELGITEAIEVGEIASAKYVILLTLNELRTGYDSEEDEYYAMTNLSVKVIDITDGKIVASKAISEKSYGKTGADAKQNLFSYLRSEFDFMIREFFKLKAAVAGVKDGKAYLTGVDIRLLRVGMIFKIESGLGREGYVKVIGEENGLAVADILYGYVSKGADAIEFPMMGMSGALTLDLYSFNLDIPFIGNNFFGLSLQAWASEAPIYFDFSFLMGSVLSYTPFTFDLGARFETLHFGRMFLGARGGFSMIGIYDTDKEDVIFSVFGAFAGADVRYEFNPRFGVFAKYDWRFYFPGFSGSEYNLGLYFSM